VSGSNPTGDTGVIISYDYAICQDDVCLTNPLKLCMAIYDGDDNLLINIDFIQTEYVSGRTSFTSTYIFNDIPYTDYQIVWDDLNQAWILTDGGVFQDIYTYDAQFPPYNGWEFPFFPVTIIVNSGVCEIAPTPTPSSV
jgi:hypothetical protein